MRDKRRFFRWACSLQCDLTGADFSGTGRIVDLSYDGACVAEASAIPVEGTDLELTLDDGSVAVALRAHVVHLGDSAEGLGLQFYGSSEERRQKLLPLFKRYLDQES